MFLNSEKSSRNSCCEYLLAGEYGFDAVQDKTKQDTIKQSAVNNLFIKKKNNCNYERKLTLIMISRTDCVVNKELLTTLRQQRGLQSFYIIGVIIKVWRYPYRITPQRNTDLIFLKLFLNNIKL